MDELRDLFSGRLVSFAYTFQGTNGMADILNPHAAGRIASIFGFLPCNTLFSAFEVNFFGDAAFEDTIFSYPPVDILSLTPQ